MLMFFYHNTIQIKEKKNNDPNAIIISFKL